MGDSPNLSPRATQDPEVIGSLQVSFHGDTRIPPKSSKQKKHYTGWWFQPTPLKNISQLGWLFPIYGKIKNVPNHQPVLYNAVYFTFETYGFWGSPISRAPPKSGPCRFQSDSPWVRHVQKRANVGNPGCHKPTMTGDGKHTTHKNGDDLGTVYMVYWCLLGLPHHTTFQAIPSTNAIRV